MYKRWILRKKPNNEIITHLSSAINVSKPIATILAQRSITDFETAKSFFRPKMQELHDPFSMKNMEVAVERIHKAIDANENILVYGDYDVDGTCAVALMYSFLSEIYSHVDYYIPDRYAEGYGISEKGVRYAKAENITLIIALDCGIRAIDQVNLGKELGIDFIICDHHKPGENLPSATAILNPKQDDCSYPYKELTGCAIGFKLIQAYAKKYDLSDEHTLAYLDFAAVSIACDIVPVTGENRIISKYGLEAINNTPRAGFKALKELAALPTQMNITNLVFGLGPRINAAGRIGHAKQAVELLITVDYEEAIKHAKEIHKKNDTRKTYDEQITSEALSMIEDNNMLQNKTTVLFKDDWHKGVIGIVASRCIENYYRPTIILTESNGKATGSARSVKGFDIHEAISTCSSYLNQFGGHKYAAGLSLEIEKVTQFAEHFEKVVANTIDPEDLIPKIEIDACLELEHITWKFFNVIEQMAPFGPENRRPIFMSEVLCAPSKYKVLKEKHLKMTVKQKESHMEFQAIAFNFGNFANEINFNESFYICYCIEKNEFRGSSTLQLMIKDIKKNLTSEEKEMLKLA